jgi:hypothetical protein
MPCSPVEVNHISEVQTASFLRIGIILDTKEADEEAQAA